MYYIRPRRRQRSGRATRDSLTLIKTSPPLPPVKDKKKPGARPGEVGITYRG